VVARRELVAGQHVVPEQPAVVDDAGDHADVAALCGGQRQLARPRLERTQDQHRPVDQVAVALEAADHVEREPVRRAGGHAHGAGQALVAQRAHALPDLGRLEAAPVGVVEQQQVERVGAEALQAALGGHAQVAAVLPGAAQARVGEAREALRAVALALVEVVAHGAHERVVAARHAAQGPPEQRVRLAGPVRVGGHQGRDAVAGPQQGL
jgi:hypothetical protein